jgi:hypothetical protein
MIKDGGRRTQKQDKSIQTDDKETNPVRTNTIVLEKNEGKHVENVEDGVEKEGKK